MSVCFLSFSITRSLPVFFQSPTLSSSLYKKNDCPLHFSIYYYLFYALISFFSHISACLKKKKTPLFILISFRNFFHSLATHSSPYLLADLQKNICARFDKTNGPNLLTSLVASLNQMLRKIYDNHVGLRTVDYLKMKS